jgi:hypothetical protein
MKSVTFFISDSHPAIGTDLRKSLGGRLTLNFNRWLAGELQYARWSRTSQGAARIKLTYRAEENWRLNLFAVAGSGFLHQSFSNSATDKRKDSYGMSAEEPK